MKQITRQRPRPPKPSDTPADAPTTDARIARTWFGEPA